MWAAASVAQLFPLQNACAIAYPDGFFDAARSERGFLYLPDRLGEPRLMSG